MFALTVDLYTAPCSTFPKCVLVTRKKRRERGEGERKRGIYLQKTVDTMHRRQAACSAFCDAFLKCALVKRRSVESLQIAV